MKILTINWTYKYGSIGKIILDIEKELDEFEFFHCFEYNTVGKSSNSYCLSNWLESRIFHRTSKIKGLQYQNGFMPTRRLLKKIEEYAPDVVHIHCPNGHTLDVYKVLSFLKSNHVPTVITNHAEFFYTGNCPHAFECREYNNECINCPDYKLMSRSLFRNRTHEAWMKMKEAFDSFDRLEMVCVSSWQAERLKGSVLCGNLPCTVVFNGVDTEVFTYRGINTKREKKIVFHATANFSNRIEDLKSGRYLIKLAQEMELKFPEIEFWVAGSSEVQQEDLPGNIRLLGSILDQEELSTYYEKADVTLITSRRETFGMACAESMCSGTPVIGFENGGTESIAIQKYSEFVTYGDVEQLKNLTVEWLEKARKIDKKQLSDDAKGEYSKQRMAEKYKEIYEQLAR